MSEQADDQLVADDTLSPAAGVEPQDDTQAHIDGDPDNPDSPPADDAEDVDYEGQKYRVPKPLKDALLRQADYTRKTQELAEQRRQIEEKGQTLTQQLERSEAISKEKVKFESLNERLAEYDKVNWQEVETFDQQNGTNHAQRVLREQLQLRTERDNLGRELYQKEQAHLSDVQLQRAKQLEEGNRVLAQKIPNWSPETAGKISAFVQSEFGLTPQEVGQITDPRWVLVAHRAMLQSEATQQQKAVQRHQASQQIQPAATTAQRAPAAKDPDRMSPDEWLKWRNAQVARKGA